jgi:hypothetical protein
VPRARAATTILIDAARIDAPNNPNADGASTRRRRRSTRPIDAPIGLPDASMGGGRRHARQHLHELDDVRQRRALLPARLRRLLPGSR